MNLTFLVRQVRILALTGAVVFAIGIGASQSMHTGSLQDNVAGHARFVDGSESTGKPPKPKPPTPARERMQFAEGSESTGSGKPPKPKPSKFSIGAIQIADGSESTGGNKPPKPKNG